MNDNTSPAIQPIETHYAGCRFRSRLEARWAVFFDHSDIAWEYEPEGYRLPGGGCYLPDFWLPQVEMYAEVKPSGPDDSRVGVTRNAIAKCIQLAMLTSAPVLILDGPPRITNYWAAFPCADFKGLDEGMPWFWCDVLLYGEPYWKTEERFYSSTGEEALSHTPYQGAGGYLGDGEAAVAAALSARFDRGQTPSRPYGR